LIRTHFGRGQIYKKGSRTSRRKIAKIFRNGATVEPSR
jgi:hypothetical protein